MAAINTDKITQEIDLLDNSNLNKLAALTQKCVLINRALDLIFLLQKESVSKSELDYFTKEVFKRVNWNGLEVSYARGFEDVLFPLHYALVDKVLNIIYALHGELSKEALPFLNDKKFYEVDKNKIIDINDKIRRIELCNIS